MIPEKQYLDMSTTTTRTVFCRDCGNELDERAEICPGCGIRQKQPEYQAPLQTQPQKDSGIAAIASFVIPGLGQVYNGEIAKGIILGLVTIAFAITGIGLLIAIPMWIWLVYDAYKTAEAMNGHPLRTTGQPGGAGSTGVQATSAEAITQHQKVTSVLQWYKKTGPYGGHTKDTLRRFKKITSFDELSANDRTRIVEAIQAHEDEFGIDQDLATVRSQLDEPTP